MRKAFTKAAAGVFAAGMSMSANAAINLPVPADDYITFNGVDWAWASPCPPSGGAGGTTCGSGPLLDLSYQSTQGWRLPTAAELATGPTVADFGTPSSFACASAYFQGTYSHCDYSDAAGGAVFGAPGGNVWYAETWVIRDAVSGAVPEPASWAMMLAGFGAIGGALRSRRKLAVSFG